jgi:hypothetical protein
VQGFGANTEGKRPLESLSSRWEDDDVMDFKRNRLGEHGLYLCDLG